MTNRKRDNHHHVALSDQEEAKLQAILEVKGWTLTTFLSIAIEIMYEEAKKDDRNN